MRSASALRRNGRRRTPQYGHGVVDRPFHRHRDCALLPHRRSGVAAEALERGLTADPEHGADLGPGMTGGAGLLDERVQGVLDDRVQAPGGSDRAHHLPRSVLVLAQHIGDQLDVATSSPGDSVAGTRAAGCRPGTAAMTTSNQVRRRRRNRGKQLPCCGSLNTATAVATPRAIANRIPPGKPTAVTDTNTMTASAKDRTTPLRNEQRNRRTRPPSSRISEPAQTASRTLETP